MVFSTLTKTFDGFSQIGCVICSIHVSILLVSCCCFQAAGAPVSGYLPRYMVYIWYIYI